MLEYEAGNDGKRLSFVGKLLQFRAKIGSRPQGKCRMRDSCQFMAIFIFVLSIAAIAGSSACAQQQDPAPLESPSMEVLTSQEWERVDESVDRALAWLASQQQRDGSFPTLPHGQPAVTSLCVLAFMAHGHLPGEGIMAAGGTSMSSTGARNRSAPTCPCRVGA